MLEKLGSKAAIPELINALVTVHRETIIEGGEGQYNVSIDKKGRSGGLTIGTSKKVINNNIRNQSVLRALKRLSGEDFGFDIDAWQEWYKNQRRVTHYNSRRGGLD